MTPAKWQNILSTFDEENRFRRRSRRRWVVSASQRRNQSISNWPHSPLSLSLSSCLCHDIDLFVSNCLCIKLFLLSFPVYLSHYVNSFDLCLSFCVCVFLFEPVILSIPSFALFFLSLLVLSYLLLPPSNPTGRPIYFVCFSPIFFLCLSNISSHYLGECLSYQSFCFDLWSLCFHFRTYESKQWMCFLFPFRYAYWPLTFLPLTFDNFLSVRILSENLPEAILPFQFLPIQLFSSVLRSFPCFAISTYCVRSRHSLTSHSLSLSAVRYSVASVGCTYNWGCESGSLSIYVATFTVSHNRNNRPWWENE